VLTLAPVLARRTVTQHACRAPPPQAPGAPECPVSDLRASRPSGGRRPPYHCEVIVPITWPRYGGWDASAPGAQRFAHLAVFLALGRTTGFLSATAESGTGDAEEGEHVHTAQETDNEEATPWRPKQGNVRGACSWRAQHEHVSRANHAPWSI